MCIDVRLENITAATMTGDDYSVIEDAVIHVASGNITWIGPRDHAPIVTANKTVDGRNGVVTPGLIDCHTHLVYGGNRADDFEQRLNGVSYEEISRQGGGILSTVRDTRSATVDELTESASKRLQHLLNEGVTTVEIKTGYGLNLESEGKMIQVIKNLNTLFPLTITTTFLGAHALPSEFIGQPDAYIHSVCNEMLPALAAEVDAVDIFCETIGFNLEQTVRIFDAAKRHGLKIRIHSEQFSNSGGTALAATYNALSADHLDYLDEAGVIAMASSGMTAVLLPGAFYFLKEKQPPPVALFRKHGVPMAIATDSNPGSSPCTSLLLMLNMACTLFKLTPAEALAGVTRNAARALGLPDRGTLEVGKKADLVLWDIRTPAELAYRFGSNPIRQVWC